MTVNSYVSLPTIAGILTNHVGDDQLLAELPGGGSIAQIDWGFLDDNGPSTGSVIIRVGNNLDGVADVDYVASTISFPNSRQQTLTNILLTATQNAIRFRVFQSSGGAADLFGTIRLESSGFGLGLVAGTRYETLQHVKDAIGGTDEIDSSHDDNLNDVIEQVSRAFDNYVGISFVGTQQIEFHDGWSFRNGIALRRMPSESSVTRAVATVEEGGTLLTQGDDWFFEPFPSRMIYRTNGTAEGFSGARFAAGDRNIKVTYASAFDNLPSEIILACREESVRAWQGFNWGGATGGRIGLASRTPAEGTVFDFVEDDLSPKTLRVLRPYREGRYIG